MCFLKFLAPALFVFPLCAMAEQSQQRFYFNDANAVRVSLDEPGTGCVMSGVLVHPVAKPQKKFIWFNERSCGEKKNKVSFISNEITSPENRIHKGEQLHITPENVVIVDLMNL